MTKAKAETWWCIECPKGRKLPWTARTLKRLAIMSLEDIGVYEEDWEKVYKTVGYKAVKIKVEEV
jgi:hypothetical protein